MKMTPFIAVKFSCETLKELAKKVYNDFERTKKFTAKKVIKK